MHLTTTGRSGSLLMGILAAVMVVFMLVGPAGAMEIRQAAILRSTLLDNVGDADQEQRQRTRITLWQDYLRAWAIRVDVIDDAALAQGLMGYQLLILPDTGTLADRQIEVVLNFLRRGNAVILTGQTGSRRLGGGSATLAGALGLRYHQPGPVDMPWWVLLDEPSGLTAGLPRMGRISVAPNPPVAIPASDATQAFWLSGDTPRGHYQRVEGNAAVHAGDHGPGRFLWLGFTIDNIGGDLSSSETFHRLLTNAFHFFHSRATFEIEPWPFPYQHACLFSSDVEERFGNIRNVTALPNLKAMTYFILTEPARLHEDVLKQIAASDEEAERTASGHRRFSPGELAVHGGNASHPSPLLPGDRLIPQGEIAVHGDNHDRFQGQLHQQQYLRLKQASDYIHQLTGKRPLGFRPPEEAYDYYTLQAMVDLGYRYMVANREPDRAEPIILHVGTQALVQIAMTNGDDVQWVTMAGRPPIDQVLASYLQDMDGIFKREGLYVVNFHSGVLATSEYIRILEDLIAYAEVKDSWIVSGEDVYHWWVRRHPVHVQVLERSTERLRIRVAQTGDQSVENLGVSVWLPAGAHSPRIMTQRGQYLTDHQTQGQRIRIPIRLLGAGEAMDFEVTWQR